MIARLLLALIRGYQLLLSPLLPPACRFEPSCSRYAAACIRAHGAGHGALLSLVRVCKCHPFNPGGYDPPPAEPLRFGQLISRFSSRRTLAPRAVPAPSQPEP